jgi:anti-sigma B factor antagonist
MSDLNITTRPTPNGTELMVAGDLDYVSADTLRAAAQAVTLRPGQTLTLNLAALTFCDSSGITALIAARNHAQAQSADTALINTPTATVHILRFVGLDQIFRIHPADALDE